MPLKRARVVEHRGDDTQSTDSDTVQASDSSWQCPDVHQAWTSCLKILQHTQQARSVHWATSLFDLDFRWAKAKAER